jgi:ABC-2 type transport system permease protein
VADPDGVAGTAGIYRRVLGAQIRSQASYRASFALDVGANTLIPALDLFTVLVLFRVTRTLGGFPAGDVLVMFGLAATAFGLADLAVGNIERIQFYVRTGMLDAVLLRPLSAFGQLVVLDFTPRRVGRVLVAAVITGVALSRAHVVWTPARAALVVVAPLAGAVIFGAVFVAGATIAFWWIDSGEFANGFTYGGRDFASYPVTIYTGVFRRAFAYTLGLGFVAYYPALALLGRTDPLGLPPWVSWASPLIAAVAALAAAMVWRLGIRHYRSTGS